jgi:hypothetical protein
MATCSGGSFPSAIANSRSKVAASSLEIPAFTKASCALIPSPAHNINAQLCGGNWTGKIEYLYLDFGTVTSTTTNLLNSTPLAVSLRSRVVDQVCARGSELQVRF